FNGMSSGRYTLSRKKDGFKGNAKAGLEIDVTDYHTGKERSANTLSGGESFMASLALALSLSEVVTAKNGGVELDSMFIDEGFGTLDSDSLSQAVKILSDLSTQSHRLTGIISHVETIKERIDSQITIEKTDKGSKLKIEF
ncbi:MAG: SMC family ATPase, partial [Bacilli bacterium]|nr:SMC family ATPase [Bacilli bacterium]